MESAVLIRPGLQTTRPRVYRLGLFDPCSSEPATLVGPEFVDSLENQSLLRAAVGNYYRRISATSVRYCAGVFVVEGIVPCERKSA